MQKKVPIFMRYKDRSPQRIKKITIMNHHLAQLNIAAMKYPLDDPRMAGFVAQLDEINALAEASEGFVWRLKDEAGNATDIRPFPDPLTLVNMSVWESATALKNYVYGSAHVGVMRQRKEWFHLMKEAYYVLWWIPHGHLPDLTEARQKLELLRTNGPSPQAFDFKNIFEPANQTNP